MKGGQDWILENQNYVLECNYHYFLSENRKSKPMDRALILSYFIFLYNVSMYFDHKGKQQKHLSFCCSLHVNLNWYFPHKERFTEIKLSLWGYLYGKYHSESLMTGSNSSSLMSIIYLSSPRVSKHLQLHLYLHYRVKKRKRKSPQYWIFSWCTSCVRDWGQVSWTSQTYFSNVLSRHGHMGDSKAHGW